MLYKYFTEKLLGLQDVDIEKIEEIDNSIHINCRLKRKPHKCPCCGNLTDKIHDYREQPIKDIPAFCNRCRSAAAHYSAYVSSLFCNSTA